MAADDVEAARDRAERCAIVGRAFEHRQPIAWKERAPWRVRPGAGCIGGTQRWYARHEIQTGLAPRPGTRCRGICSRERRWVGERRDTEVITVGTEEERGQLAPVARSFRGEDSSGGVGDTRDPWGEGRHVRYKDLWQATPL